MAKTAHAEDVACNRPLQSQPSWFIEPRRSSCSKPVISSEAFSRVNWREQVAYRNSRFSYSSSNYVCSLGVWRGSRARRFVELQIPGENPSDNLLPEFLRRPLVGAHSPRAGPSGLALKPENVNTYVQ